jgi:predicted kinase
VLYVITGPPSSGKSTYALAQAKAADIVIDYDRIAVALAGTDADSHDHPRVLKRVAHKARYAAIAEALDRLADADVYLIHSMPSEHNLARYKSLNAKLITLDPGRSIVEQRCRATRPQLLAVVGKWYAWHARQSAPPAGEPPAAATAAAAPSGERRASRAW